MTLPIDPEHRLPHDFVWGVATSAFQIEGAADEDGKGESIWDVFCRRPGVIADGSDGRIACDHVHRLDEDLDLIASLGVDAYRFSISWPRVQPQGWGPWSDEGLDFYERLVDGLLARGIRPFATLNHWDLPQVLQTHGGWVARDTVHRFVDYARGVHRRLGDRLASIATHNEPWVIAILGHEKGIFAPGLTSRAAAAQVNHHLLLSHGLALQALRAEGCSAPLGIVLNMSPQEPATDDPADQALARLQDGHGLRWYMDPLLRGSYPDDVWADLGADAPRLEPGDLAAIAQPLDWLGINYYTRTVASQAGPWDPAAHGRPVTDMGWEICPESFHALLTRLHRDYPLPPTFITENGGAFADPVQADGLVHDSDRIDYLRTHIDAVVRAAHQGVPLAGYFVWSLMDNFEWASGYAKRFGIVHVDYPTQARTPKASALAYRDALTRWRAGAAR